MSSPKVSILTTIYNREAFLEDCIRSVQRSHFQDYELILVDDGSTDASIEIAHRLAEQDERIQLHLNESNLGDYPNRNKAASLARGQYIKYLDADDMLGRWTLDMMVDAMDMHPDAALGLVDYSKPGIHWPEQLSPEEAFARFYSGKTDMFKRSPLSAIIRRDVFESVGGFTGKRMVGDFEMWHRIAENHPVVLIPHALSFYRKHDDQEMSHHRADPIWAFRYFIISLEQLGRKECPLDETQRDAQRRKVRRTAGRSILHAIRHYGWKKGRQMMDEIGWTPRETWKAAMEK